MSERKELSVRVQFNGRELLNYFSDTEETQVHIKPHLVKPVIDALRNVANELEQDFSHD